MEERKIELLAPAGNVESFKAAVNAGADAIYMGLGKHNARVMAKNFTLQDYIECIKYAHIRDVKVYLTLNTLLLDEEIEEAMNMLMTLYENGLDAVILQDIGLASIIHKVMPDLPMHASTQMSVYSLEQVKFLEEMGFKRVVLARELTLEEVKYIASNTTLEIEEFVHGALCVCLSGQCLLSLAIGTRSANRGACAQPCRMKYSLLNSNNEVIEKNTYLLSKKDIFGLDSLDKIINSNITSLKVEGRNKTPEYVALVISLYRKYIDMYNKTGEVKVSKEDEKNLLQIFNRNGKSDGYLNGIRYKNSITTLSPKNTGLYLGEVIEKKGKLVKIKLNEDIELHDGVEIYCKNEVVSSLVTCIKNEKLKLINSKVESGNIVYIGDFKSENIKKNDKVYKTSSYSLNSSVATRYLQKNIRKRNLVLNINIKENSPITLSVIINNQMYTYNTNILPEKAMNKEITMENIEQTFSKTQDYGIAFSKVVGYIQKGLFVKVATLNEIRRNFVEKIEKKLCTNRDVSDCASRLKEALDVSKYSQIANANKQNILSVYTYNKEIMYDVEYNKKYNLNLDRIDFQINEYINNENDIFHKYSKYNLGVSIPNFTLNNLDRYINGNIERLLKKGIKTIILGSFRYLDLILKLKQKYEFTLVADYPFNVTNIYSAIFLKNLGFDYISPAFDSTPDQTSNISKYIPIELVDDYITVMTSRYCMLGAFVADRKEDKSCTAPCTKDRYYILDKYNERYEVLSNNLDCTMKIVKKYKLNNASQYKNANVRNNII